MLAQNYLTLRSVRLKSGEEWIADGQGLSFVFPKRGAGRCVCEQVAECLIPGDVLALAAGWRGRLCVSGQGELLFQSFSICLEHLFPLFASSEICRLQSVLEGFKGDKLFPASSSLAKECHRLLRDVPAEFNLDHRSQLLRIAAAVLSVEFKTAQRPRAGFVRAEEHMVQVLKSLPAAELLNLSVGQLATRFSVSRRHLNRLFHHHFGISVSALRMEIRLSKAVTLLRDPDVKVINVAEQSGFNHLGLFNTCFKRRFGTSPGRWRRMRVEIATQAAGLLGRELTCPLHANGLCRWPGQARDFGCEAREASPAQTADSPVASVASKLNVTIARNQLPINGKQVAKDRIRPVTNPLPHSSLTYHEPVPSPCPSPHPMGRGWPKVG